VSVPGHPGAGSCWFKFFWAWAKARKGGGEGRGKISKKPKGGGKPFRIDKQKNKPLGEEGSSEDVSHPRGNQSFTLR